LGLATNEKIGTFIKSTVMKPTLLLALLTAFFVAACEVDEPPPAVRHKVTSYPQEPSQQYPPPEQPFNPNGPVQPQTAVQESTPPPPTAAPTKVSKGDFPYGIPVPGKKNLVESPFSPGKYVDVEGFAPGTEVKDPYTGKIFLVP
jgi:hypothetical protein